MWDRLDAALGTLVAVGGAEDRTSDLRVLSRLIALAPTEAPDVAVIATASGIPHEVLPAYRTAFGRLGAAAVHLLDVRRRAQAQDPDACAAVARSGVIFFTGGDQMRLTHVLGGSPLLQAIRRRYLEGAVVAGTSAGAAALPATMIAEGDAVDALRKNGVKMASGLGFVDGLIVDTHFMQRGRFARLMAAGAANPEQLGVGLGEDTGVILHDRRTLEAIGPGHTILVDSRSVAGSTIAEAEDGAAIAIEHVVLHALIEGHGYDLLRGRYLNPADLARQLADRPPAPPPTTAQRIALPPPVAE